MKSTLNANLQLSWTDKWSTSVPLRTMMPVLKLSTKSATTPAGHSIWQPTPRNPCFDSRFGKCLQIRKHEIKRIENLHVVFPHPERAGLVDCSVGQGIWSVLRWFAGCFKISKNWLVDGSNCYHCLACSLTTRSWLFFDGVVFWLASVSVLLMGWLPLSTHPLIVWRLDCICFVHLHTNWCQCCEWKITGNITQVQLWKASSAKHDFWTFCVWTSPDFRTLTLQDVHAVFSVQVPKAATNTKTICHTAQEALRSQNTMALRTQWQPNMHHTQLATNFSATDANKSNKLFDSKTRPFCATFPCLPFIFFQHLG